MICKTHDTQPVPELSWLEHYTDNVGVSGSSPLGTTIKEIGELAQLARAPALQAGGQGFDSLILHEIRPRMRFRPHFWERVEVL